jgi:electron transport complex protein RnfG
MDTADRRRLAAAAYVTIIAAVAGGVIALSHELSSERIETNQRERLAMRLHEVLGQIEYDNDPEAARHTLGAASPARTATPAAVYVAARAGAPVAFVFTVTAARGYNGPIELLVGIAADGRIAGVRVTSHRETPGLGDAIEAGKSSWIDGFIGTRLGAPPLGDWRVRKDGGAFDAITGATVTPRAVVEAVRDALVYFRDHQDQLSALAEEEPDIANH